MESSTPYILSNLLLSLLCVWYLVATATEGQCAAGVIVGGVSVFACGSSSPVLKHQMYCSHGFV